MKTFKEFISEEGYDRLRDQGRIRPSKDKKDATTLATKSRNGKDTEGIQRAFCI